MGSQMGDALLRASYQPHVLLAEGDPCTLRAIRTLLQTCGYRVSAAKDGQEALSILQSTDRFHIDLVLADYFLPKLEGLGLVSEVMGAKELPPVPVIVMTAQASQELTCKALQAGAVDCLEKPIRHNEVVTMWQHVWKSTCRPQSGLIKESPLKDTVASDTSVLGVKDTSGSLSQEDGSSGCEGQSSCTIATPAAKRTKREGVAVLSGVPQISAGTYESSALNIARGQLDVVGDSERHVQHAAGMHDTEMVEAAVILRPHEAPVFSSAGPALRMGLPRILSAPSMLAAPSVQRLQAQAGSVRKRPCLYASCSEDAAHMCTAVCAAVTDEDSGDSAATAEDVAGEDASPFAAFCKLSGCESAAVSSPVHLEIVPLDLTLWPSNGSTVGSLGSMGRQPSFMAPPTPAFKEQRTQRQVEAAAAASLCDLAKAFAGAVPRATPRSAPPLLQPLKVHVSPEPSSEKGSAPTHKPAEGSSTPAGPSSAKQHQHPFGKALRAAADLHSGTTQGDPAVWAANRKAALEKLREKKKLRSFRKKVRYESRQRLAESRPRVRGQFVKASTEAA